MRPKKQPELRHLDVCLPAYLALYPRRVPCFVPCLRPTPARCARRAYQLTLFCTAVRPVAVSSLRRCSPSAACLGAASSLRCTCLRHVRTQPLPCVRSLCRTSPYRLDIGGVPSAAPECRVGRVPFVMDRGGGVTRLRPAWLCVPPRGLGRTTSRACWTSPSGACSDTLEAAASCLQLSRWPAALTVPACTLLRLSASQAVCARSPRVCSRV